MFENIPKRQDNLPKTPEKALIKPKSFFENTLDVGRSFKKASDAFDSKITNGITKLLSRGADKLDATTIETMKTFQSLGKATVREASWKIEDAQIAKNTIENNVRLAELNKRSQNFTAQNQKRLETLRRQLNAQESLKQEREKYRERNAA